MNLDEVLNIVESKELDEILGVIYDCYLSNREKKLYSMLVTYISGKSQIALGILFNIHQDKVSTGMSRLKKKLRRIYFTLTTRTVELRELDKYLSDSLSKQQYETAEFLLLGKKKIRISEQFSCSPAHVTAVIKRIHYKLTSERSSQLSQLVRELR